MEGEGEFAVAEVVRGDWRVVEPLEEETPGEETLVEGVHHLGI